jgi:hypothetical protein
VTLDVLVQVVRGVVVPATPPVVTSVPLVDKDKKLSSKTGVVETPASKLNAAKVGPSLQKRCLRLSPNA